MKSNIDVDTLSRITFLRLSGKSLPEIAEILTAEKYTTVNGGGWYPSTVRQYLLMASRLLKRLPPELASKPGRKVKSDAPARGAPKPKQNTAKAGQKGLVRRFGVVAA